MKDYASALFPFLVSYSLNRDFIKFERDVKDQDFNMKCTFFKLLLFFSG